jgi:hypothetical protein
MNKLLRPKYSSSDFVNVYTYSYFSAHLHNSILE